MQLCSVRSALFLTFLLALGACDGDAREAAEPCQVDRDCAAGFACSDRGYCAPCGDDAGACGACTPGDLGLLPRVLAAAASVVPLSPEDRAAAVAAMADEAIIFPIPR